ncbi:hypothetical protein Bca4012_026683 [Brassica carinata]
MSLNFGSFDGKHATSLFVSSVAKILCFHSKWSWYLDHRFQSYVAARGMCWPRPLLLGVHLGIFSRVKKQVLDSLLHCFLLTFNQFTDFDLSAFFLQLSFWLLI